MDLSLFVSKRTMPRRSRPRHSTASLRCRAVTLHVRHQLHLRLQRVVFQLLRAHALSDRQLHLIWEHLKAMTPSAWWWAPHRALAFPRVDGSFLPHTCL